MTNEEKKRWNENNRMIEEIHRGMYGDPKNDTPGLIERQKKDEKVMCDHDLRIAKLERFKKRFTLGIGGISLSGGTIHWWDSIKEFLTNWIK